MPFLLADDAADEATRRLQEFGQQQLASLRQGAQDLGASAQDATQRLMSFGQQQLSSSIGTLQPPPNPLQQLPTPDVGAVTDRLQSFGQQALTSATQGAQQAQQGIQQLQPLKPLAPPSAPPAPQGQSLDQPQQPQPQSDQPLDKNGVIAYVQQKARDFGLDPAAVLAVANQEGLNTDPGSKWQLPGEKNISFGPPSWYGNGAGADIIAKHGDDAARWSWTPEGIDYWLGQVQGAARGLVGDDAVEAIVNKFERPREDLAAGEIAKAKQAYNQFVGGVQQGAQDLTQAATSKLSDISQFGDKQLSQAEAYAACGPAAAVRFAQLYGRNPTLREATDLAKSVGWSADQGMAGLSSEGSLFDKLGIPHRTVGADWDTLAREASSGNPVVISTPGHYFTADAYDPSTGAFHVGQSGKDLVHGSEWMTPAQMEQRMGGLQGGLAVDNPGVATPSPTSVPPSGGQQNPLQSALDTAGQAKDRGVQILDAAVSTAGDLATGGLTRRFNQNLQGLASDVTAGGTKTPLQVGGDLLDQAADTADKIAPGGGGLIPSDLMRTGANFLRSPGVLDSMQILQDLNSKYGTMDTDQYSPEDRRAAGQALVAVGGVVSGGGAEAPGTSRMFHGTSADFPRATPEAISSERNLYGPGYYLTSDPRVAGGVIARGGEPDPLGPLMREGRPFERGDVIQAGYAQQNPNATSDTLDLGANVRAVDVPGHLNLLDMEQPVAPQQAAAIAQQLNTLRPGAWDLSDPEVRAEVASWSQPGADGESVYSIVRGELDGTKAAANKVLAQAGFDGITYAGGKRIPMADEAGVPIEHQATVIFPESLDKVTNAVSGTPGGQVAAPFAAGLGGAAALGLGAKALLDNRDNFQAPFTLDDVKDRLDDLGSKLEDFRQQQAATSPIQPGGWTAPVARGLEAANDVLQQRSRDLDPAQITQDYLDAIRSGDVGGILNAAARGADVASGPAGTSLADVSSPLSAGLTAAGVDPNVSRVLGQAGNLIGPAALEGVIGRGLPAVAGGLATGESGALKLGATSAMDRATAAAGNLRQAVTGPVAQQLEQDLKGRVTAQELADARQTLQGVEGGSSALNPYPGAQTPQGLALLRRQLLSLAKQGALQKDWYDVSSRQIMDAAQGNKQDAEKIAQLAGIYSNNTPVDKNLDDALTAWHQWKAGEPINAPNMGGPNQRARDLLERGVPWEGRKTNNFYRNLMMHIDPDVFTALGKESVDGVKQTGVTIDVWMQRALNSLRKSPSTQAQYDWAADEIRRVADQLGWRPDQAQAAIWSAAKAGWEDEKYGTDLSRAGWSYADALRKRLTNPVGNLDEQLEAALKDPATGTDELARAFGLLGGNGEVSIPQAQQSRTIDGKTIKFPENVGKVQPQARTLINAYTAARALLTKAPQLGWARLFPMGKVADANAMKATSPDGRWSPEAVAEMQGHLNDLLGADSGVHVIPSQDGAWVLNRGTTPNTAFHNAVVTASNKLQSIDDVTLSRQAHDGEILSNDWNSNPNGEDYLAAIRQSGSERASEFQRAAERLQPAVDDVLGRTAGGAGAAEEANAPGSRLGDFLANEDGSLNLDRLGRVLQAARVGSLAGGLPTLAHIALNTPVQIGTKLASDLAANVRYPEATAAELYGAMQGLRAWGLNAASTLNQPGPLARSMGATSTLSAPGALETGLTGAVKLHPVLQDIPRQMANYMELYRTAAQQATDAGLARGGAAWRAEVARLVASPTAAMQSAANFAAGTAGLSGRMGTTGTAISQLIHDAPLARFALPIFDIGYKIASKGVEMTPTLGPLGTAWDVARGLTGTGPYAGGNWAGRGANEAVTPLAERVRNHLIGLALMYEGYQQAAQGNVTGEGPEDPAEQAALRQTGWQPSSVRLGGRYFDAHLLGQLGWPLIAGANLYEARNGPGGQGLPLKKTPTGEEQPGVLDELGDYVARQGRYFNDETFLRGVGDILNLMGAGFQQGQVPQQEAASVLQSIVPQGALLANYAASQDPFQRNPRAGANPLEDIQNALLARLPGQREQLQPRLSATGRQLSNPQQGLGILMPRSSVVQGDPILDELAKVGVKPTNVPGTLSFGSANEVKLTPQEQFRWQQYRGQALTDAATKLMSSSAYRKLDDGTDKGKIAQRNAVAAVVSSSAQVADGKLRQELAKDTSALRSRFIATGPLAPAYGYGTGGYTPLSQPLSEQTGQ